MIALDEIARFLFPFNVPVQERNLFVISGAYFDESDAEGCFSVAGYLANYTVWMHLDWKWGELLEKWEIEYFKASECNNGLEQFAQYRDNPSDHKGRLKDHEKLKLRSAMTEFIDAVCKVQDELHGVGAVIIKEDFQRLVSEDVEVKKLLGSDPYYICMQLSLVAAASIVRESNLRLGRRDNFVKPIFDSHKEYSKQSGPLYPKFAAKNPRSAEVLMPPNYESDVLFKPLQVADLVAYEARKLLVGELRTPTAKERVAMSRLTPGINRVYRLDYATLKMLAGRQMSDSIPISPAIENGKLNEGV